MIPCHKPVSVTNTTPVSQWPDTWAPSAHTFCTCSNPIVLTKSLDGSQVSGRQRFNYLFYIDFVGALSDPVCQNALRHLQESAPFMRVLGSYPMELALGSLDSNTPFDSISEA